MNTHSAFAIRAAWLVGFVAGLGLGLVLGAL